MIIRFIPKGTKSCAYSVSFSISNSQIKINDLNTTNFKSRYQFSPPVSLIYETFDASRHNMDEALKQININK